MPARGYSRPPFQPGNDIGRQFEPGNVASLQHGGYSPRKVDPLAEEIIDATRQHVTWWRPADEASVWAWARIEARVQLITEWLMDRGGDLEGDGAIRPAADLLTKLEARAESMRSRLGLEPLSRARLGRDIAAQNLDLARYWAQEAQEAAKQESGGGEESAHEHNGPSSPAQRPQDDDAAA